MPPTNRARGLDVSHHRPVKDWSALLRAPERPVIVGIKATEGLKFTDPMLMEHRKGFRDHPFLLGVYYHFARSGNAFDQAKRFQDRVGPLENNERLCLDLEVTPASSQERALDWVDAFYSELMGGACSDRRPFIYTSKRKWDEICGGKPWVLGTTEVDLWAPRYNGTGTEPKLPRPWEKRGWSIWQWSDGDFPTHELPGVGECDGNYWKDDEDDLRAYMDGSLKGGDDGAIRAIRS